MYEYNENKLPLSKFIDNKIKPIYKTVDGWQTSTEGISELNNLPDNAIKYIKIIEDLTETKISIISTGPERKETIDINGTLSNI